MRAVPGILRARPGCHIVILGGDGVSYGQPAPGGLTWWQTLLDEVGPLDMAREHMTGPLGHRDYLSLLQISSAHVYLTVPFVLSWSCAEALLAGCLVVGSRTPPVEEVIEHGRNGMLVDFLSPRAIAETVTEALCGDFPTMRRQARQSALERFDLERCLPRQIELARSLA